MDTSLVQHQGKLLGAFATELCTVIGSLLDVPASVVPTDTAAGVDWIVHVRLTGANRGSLFVGFPAADASAIASKLMGLDGESPDEAVADTLQEIVAQAAGALSQQPLGLGTSFAIEGAPRRSGSVPDGAPLQFQFSVGDMVPTSSCWTDAVPEARPESTAPEVEQVRPVADAAPPPAAAPPAASPAKRTDNLDIILDVMLPITVRFGRAELTVQALTGLGPGSVLELDRSPDDPVEILINGRMIARGEVVVVGGNYGVRVTEVTSAGDRIRTLGA